MAADNDAKIFRNQHKQHPAMWVGGRRGVWWYGWGGRRIGVRRRGVNENGGVGRERGMDRMNEA